MLKRGSIVRILICWAGFPILTFAQPLSDFNVTGKIADSVTRAAIPHATILISHNSKTTSRLSTDQGEFDLSAPLYSSITISAVGYVGYRFQVIGNERREILLQPLVRALNEVTVKVAKPIVRQEIDRLVYDVQENSSVNSLNSLELLGKVPLISVLGSEEILVNGMGGVRLLVNGRNHPLANRDPAAFLRAINATDLLRVEVITNPPAKYDAEGISLINIVLNRRTGSGFKGTASARAILPGLIGSNSSVDYKQGAFGISGFISASKQNLPSSRKTNNRSDIFDDASFVDQNGTFRNAYTPVYFGGDLYHNISALNLINANIGTSLSPGTRNTSSLTRISGGSEVRQYRQTNTGNRKNESINFSFNYQNEGKRNKLNVLTVSYLHARAKIDESDFLSPSEEVNMQQSFRRQESMARAIENSLQVDYEFVALKDWSFDAGVKSILRDNITHNIYEDWLFADRADLAVENDKLNHSQDVFAGYASSYFKRKNFGIKTGVRLENTRSNATIGDLVSQNTFKNNDFRIVPSVLVQYRRPEKSISHNISFSRRIERPSIYQLNPFVNTSNRQMYSSGNPALLPVVYNSFEYTYSNGNRINYRIGYNLLFARNTIQSITTEIGDNVFLSTYENLGNTMQSGFNFYTSFSVGENFDMSVSSRLHYHRLNGKVSSTAVHNDGLVWAVISNGAYSFEKNWRVDYYFNLSSPRVYLQQRTNWFYDNSMGVSKSFFNRKLTASGMVLNPFTRYQRQRIETYLEGFRENSLSENPSRQFMMNLSYRFGKLKEAIKKTKKAINNNDLKPENN